MTAGKAPYVFDLEVTHHHFHLILLVKVSHMAKVKEEEKYTLSGWWRKFNIIRQRLWAVLRVGGGE